MTRPEQEAGEGVARFLTDVQAEVERARAKFPGNRHQCVAFSEEAGEVANALLEHGNGSAELWEECVQAAAMAMRLAEEGDGDFDGEQGYANTAEASIRPPAPSPHEGEAARCEACEGTGSYYPGNPCKFCHGTGQRPAPTEGEAARCDESLGEWNGGLCEYGCEGECDELSHWRLRFAYLLATAPAPSPHEGEAARCDTGTAGIRRFHVDFNGPWSGPNAEWLVILNDGLPPSAGDRVQLYDHDGNVCEGFVREVRAQTSGVELDMAAWRSGETAPTEPRSISEDEITPEMEAWELYRCPICRMTVKNPDDIGATCACEADCWDVVTVISLAERDRQVAELRAERDTAQASEARMREALERIADPETRWGRDVRNPVTHMRREARAALASTPNPEERCDAGPLTRETLDAAVEGACRHRPRPVLGSDTTPIYRCQEVSSVGVARCDLPAGHTGQHSGWSEDRTFLVRWPEVVDGSAPTRSARLLHPGACSQCGGTAEKPGSDPENGPREPCCDPVHRGAT